MTVVVDASVALKWVLPEEGAAEAAILRRHELVAPDLWLSEAGNAIWRRALKGEFDARTAATLYRVLRTSDVTSVQSSTLAAQALTLSLELRHPIYDCFYVAAAIECDTHVITADGRFWKATRESPYEDRVRLLRQG